MKTPLSKYMFAMLLAACGSSEESVHEECWAGLGESVADDQPIALGSRVGSFAPFDDESVLTLESGVQGGFHTFLNLSVGSIDPGSATSEDPFRDNPQTRFSVTFADGERADFDRCPVRRHYESDGVDEFSLEFDQQITLLFEYVQFNQCGEAWLAQNGERVESITVTAEILDCDGKHAFASREIRNPEPGDCPPQSE